MDSLFLTLMIASLTTVSMGYHNGAPNTACDSMTPGHGVPAQTGKSPYRVMMEKTEVGAGEVVNILLTASTAGPPFKGFFIQVHDRNGDQAVGEFSPDSDENSKPVNCGGKTNSAMTHKDFNEKSQVRLKWTPSGEGEYVPVVTWVKQQNTFWVKEMPDGKTIKVSAGTSGSGGAAEAAKPKHEGDNNANKNNGSSSPSGDNNSGQNFAVSLISTTPSWITGLAITGMLFMHRLF